MRRIQILIFGLFPALLVATGAILVGIAKTPPRYIARAAFVIEWTLMPSLTRDESGEKVRNDWRKSVIPQLLVAPSQETASDFLDRCPQITSNKLSRSGAISRLQRWLRVKPREKSDKRDLFIVEMRDSNSNWASVVLQCAVQQNVNWLNRKAKWLAVEATGRSEANVDDIVEKRDSLKKQLRTLDPESWQASVLQRELDQLEWQELPARIEMGVNAAGVLLASPASIVEKVHVEKRKSDSVVTIVLVALLSGFIAGAVGL